MNVIIKMRKSLLFLVFIVVSFSLWSQNSTSQKIYATAYGNILYKGVQNPLAITDYGNKNIYVSANNGAIVKKGKVPGFVGDYYVTIPAALPTSEVTVSISLDGNVVAKQTFKVVDIPSPSISIGGYKSGGDIPKSAIKPGLKLEAIYDGFFPFADANNCTVTSFSYIKEVRGVTSSQIINGNTIPADIVADMSRKASGSAISFVDIKVSTPSGISVVSGFTARLR